MLRHSASMPRLWLHARPKRNFARNLSFMSVEEPLGRRETYDQNLLMPQWKSGLSTEEFSFLEGDHSFTVSANLSGFKKEDLKVYVDQNYGEFVRIQERGSQGVCRPELHAMHRRRAQRLRNNGRWLVS
jgi:HSP20 family molecular chaperone IbpA